MAAPSCVFTITRVARMLDQDEAWLEEIALDMEPEDGRLWICDLDDDIAVTAFTPFGVESLKELIEINKDLRLSNKVATPRGSPQGYAAAGSDGPRRRPGHRPIASPGRCRGDGP